jgi:hypothetical protein
MYRLSNVCMIRIQKKIYRFKPVSLSFLSFQMFILDLDLNKRRLKRRAKIKIESRRKTNLSYHFFFISTKQKKVDLN